MNNIITLFIIVPILAFVLLALNLLLATHRPYEAKLSIYECGFEPVPEQTRSKFSIQFYIVGLLFLIFDLEIMVCYPFGVVLYGVSIYGFSIFLIFFIVLTVGFAYEIAKGVISLEKINPNS